MTKNLFIEFNRYKYNDYICVVKQRPAMNIKTAPLWKWILMFIVSGILAFLGYGVIDGFQIAVKQAIMAYIFPPLTILGLYVVFTYWIEKEWAPDVVRRRAFTDLLTGLSFGAVYLLVVAGIIYLCGCVSFEKFTWDSQSQLIAFLSFFGVAVGEEIIFRGVLFKWIDKRWGMWPALLVSAFVFGFAHLTNDNGSVWSSISISVEAGLLFGMIYKWSGSLWIPIGIHWTWNYVQGNILGFAVSGTDAGTTWYKAIPSGPDLISGGAFGAEASIVSFVLGLVLTALLVRACYKSSSSVGI
jgi:membrane protease YdiL (CAAX protease family)